MNAARGEIWLVDLSPTRGREQRGTRPALVVSADRLNQGRAGLAVVLPITTRDRGIPSHVPISQTDSDLDHDSFILTEQIRSVSTERLLRSLGLAHASVLEQVDRWLRVLLDL